MNKSLIKLHKKYMKTEWIKEDMRLLQKVVSGRSVYRSAQQAYKRHTKHRQLAFED